MKGREARDIPRQFSFTMETSEMWLREMNEKIDEMSLPELRDVKKRLDAMEARLPYVEIQAENDFQKEIFNGYVKSLKFVQRRTKDAIQPSLAASSSAIA